MSAQVFCRCLWSRSVYHVFSNGCPENWLPFHLEYADDVLLSKSPGKLQILLDHLDDIVAMFGMRFTFFKCKTLSQNWINPKPNRVPANKQLGEIDRPS